jgi:linoleoyl-CoA desaturase
MLMGLGMAGIGMGVMHDANHGSYSKNSKLNSILGYFSISLPAENYKLKQYHHVYRIHIERQEQPGILPDAVF